MKRFEVGKTYKVYDKGEITITKRTKCYATFTGTWSGRKLIDAYGEHGIFGLGESMVIPSGISGVDYLVFAKNEKGAAS